MKNAAKTLTQRVLLLAASAFASASVGATSMITPVTEIAAAAESAVRERFPRASGALYTSAQTPDPRLRLAQCATPLKTTTADRLMASEQVLVEVGCERPVAWSVYVRDTLRSVVDTLVTRRALPRGAVLSEVDLTTQQREVPGAPANYVKSLADISGYILRRPLPAGVSLTIDALEPAPTVRKGTTVSVLAEAAGFTVRTSGVALADARPGERVRIRNLTSLKIFEGLADNHGVVRVGP